MLNESLLRESEGHGALATFTEFAAEDKLRAPRSTIAVIMAPPGEMLWREERQWPTPSREETSEVEDKCGYLTDYAEITLTVLSVLCRRLAKDSPEVAKVLDVKDVTELGELMVRFNNLLIDEAKEVHVKAFHTMWKDAPTDAKARAESAKRLLRTAGPAWIAAARYLAARDSLLTDGRKVADEAEFWKGADASRKHLLMYRLDTKQCRDLAAKGTLLGAVSRVAEWCAGTSDVGTVQKVSIRLLPDDLATAFQAPSGSGIVRGRPQWDDLCDAWSARADNIGTTTDGKDKAEAMQTVPPPPTSTPPPPPTPTPPSPFHKAVQEAAAGRATPMPVGARAVWTPGWDVSVRAHEWILDRLGDTKDSPLNANRSGLEQRLTPVQAKLLSSMTDDEKKARVGRCYQCGARKVIMGHAGCQRPNATKPFSVSSYRCCICGSGVTRSQGRNSRPRCEECRSQIQVPPRLVDVADWKTADQEERVELLIDDERVWTRSDSGQDFSSVHQKLLGSRPICRKDTSLSEMHRLGLKGADGSNLRLPHAVVKRSVLRWPDGEQGYRVKWFVVKSGPVAWVLGRNLLDAMRRPSEAEKAGAGARDEAERTGDVGPIRAGAARMDRELTLEEVLSRGRWGEVLEKAGMVKCEPFKIDTVPGADPSHCVMRVMRKFTYEEKEALLEYIEQALKNGLLTYSKSPANAAIVMETQKNKIRTCIDYKLVNALTRDCVQNIPNVTEVIADFEVKRLEAIKANGGKPVTIWVSVMDAVCGYGQLKMDPASRKFTAFTTHDGRHLEAKDGCTFGLMGLPQFYNRVMSEFLRSWELDGVAKSVFDDILVMTFGDEQEHLRALARLMDAIRADGWTMKKSKSKFLVKEFDFSGVALDVSDGTIKLSANRRVTDQIQDMRMPTSAAESRSFASLVSTIGRYVPRIEETRAYFAKRIAEQKQGQMVVWSADEREKWSDMVDKIVNSRALREPEPGAQTFFFMDASQTAECIMAYQGHAEWSTGSKGTPIIDWEASDLHLVGCVSRAFRGGCQEDWPPWKKEAHCFNLLDERFGHITACTARDGQRHVVLVDSEICVKMLSSKNIKEHAVRAWMAKAARSYIEVYWVASGDNVADVGTRGLFGHDISGLDTTNPLMRDGVRSRVKGPVSIIAARRALAQSPESGRPLSDWIAEAHDSHEAGHAQYQSTWFRMQQNGFTGPEPKEAIAQYLESCEICQRADKKGRLEPPLTLVPIPGVPWQHIHMDLKVMNAIDAHGYRYILVVVDACTSAVVLVSLKRKTADEVMGALMLHVVGHYGYPTVWSSDNGGEFINDKLCTMLGKAGAARRDILPYEPQGNGKAERVMGMLSTRLQRLVTEDKKRWSEAVPSMMLGINTALFTPTGSSRANALMGYDPVTAARDRSEAVKEGRTELLERHRKDRARVKESYDRRNATEDIDVEPGALVRTEIRSHDSDGKMDFAWSEPKHVQSVSGVNITVSSDKDSPIDTFSTVHARRVKKVVDRPAELEPRDLTDEMEVDKTDTPAAADDATEGQFGISPVQLAWDDESIEAARALVRATEGAGRRGPEIITFDHRDLDEIESVTGHRRNDGGVWEFRVKWNNGSGDMWIPAAVGTGFCKPLQGYIFSLDEVEQDPRIAEICGTIDHE